ncbi:MAG: acyl-CoA dehydrogenase family protein [Pirellulales bacterium]|nr:acyl-CoA dehydrogenase family protein [Pirellulales bacterium]
MGTMQREEQIAQAEELLGDRLQKLGFVRGLYFGKYLAEKLPRYPAQLPGPQTTAMLANLRKFLQNSVDPVEIDRAERIPESVIVGLGGIGVLGACLPTTCGGHGLTQTEYCRLLEILGGHCASTALFVNAHHSIGPRALVLFGTPAQQEKYLPKLASGEWISAFALTEPEAGSDAANVQTIATPTPDGRGYILNGTKRWITNGGIAQVLTVIAKVPVPMGDKATPASATGNQTYPPTKLVPTAFIVTPDMPGFRVLEERMPKCGVRGTATGRLAFENMYVPAENVLGAVGKGLKIALTVLDFGRTTFGASCTGAAKFCVEHAVRHAQTRVQFGQPLASFGMVREKLAWMAAGVFAMEACTYQTAALIDAGEEDYMLETAMLKVFATETLWRIINDTIQIYGGKAYFTDEPFERMLRDARINMIGEGANDVLRAFVALVGMRDVGLELQGILQAVQSPWKNLSRLSQFAGERLESYFRTPEVRVQAAELHPQAERLGRLTAYFGGQVEKALAKYREEIVDQQLQAGRIADAAIDLYVSACVLRRMDAILVARDVPVGQAGMGQPTHGANGANGQEEKPSDPGKTISGQLAAGRYALELAETRIRRNLADLWDNDDALIDDVLRGI